MSRGRSIEEGTGSAADVPDLPPDPGGWEALIAAARSAVDAAHAPYSGFRVGAAVMAATGRIHTGANVEVSSYGLTLCAERLAVFSAVHRGERVLTHLALVTETARPVSPCGACRQVLHEFGPDAEIALLTRDGDARFTRIRDLLPDAFDPSVLPRHPARR